MNPLAKLMARNIKTMIIEKTQSFLIKAEQRDEQYKDMF